MKELDGGGFLPSTPSSELNRSWLLAYIAESDQPTVIAAIDEAIRFKTTFDLEHRVVREDGTVGWTLSQAVPLLGPKGEIVEWFGAASDISARRDAVTALRESKARLRELNATLEQRVEQRTAERNCRAAAEIPRSSRGWRSSRQYTGDSPAGSICLACCRCRSITGTAVEATCFKAASVPSVA